MTALVLLDDCLNEAFESWVAFTETRSDEDWRAFRAAFLRAQMVNANLGIGFTMPRPVLRVKASPRVS